MAEYLEGLTLAEKLESWLWHNDGRTCITETLRDTTMLHELFYWLLNMSIAGTVTGLIIWLIGRWKRVPRRLAHGLWVLPLMRLWLPLNLTSPLSVYALLPEGTVTTVPYAGFIDDRFSGMNSIQMALSYNPVTYRTDTIHRIFTVAGVIWGIVAAALLLIVIMTALHGHRGTRCTELLSPGVHISDHVDMPAVYGICSARIILPRHVAEPENPDLPHILAHEHAHIRRADNLWRLIAVTTACIHWFNPFAWWMLRAFLRETEAACDESVISHLDEEGRKAYARALVNAAESRIVLASPFGSGSLRSRITRIMSFRRMTIAGTAAFLILAAALAWALLTNAP